MSAWVLFLFDPSPTVDNDGDGFTADLDCDDDDPTVHPGAAEQCNAVDDDCDIDVDEDLVFTEYYPDFDADGFGDSSNPIATCDGPPVGYVTSDGDCDDTNVDVNPGVVDRCNLFDEDCDGQVDEDATYLDFYPDRDHDDYGDPSESITRCDEAPPGYVREGTDCDDDDPTVHPGAEDVCNGLDEDCDTEIDEDAPLIDGYADRDGDDFGDPSDPVSGCDELADGYVTDGTDCDDDDPDVHPDAVEVCNTVDDDCDGDPDDGGVCASSEEDDPDEKAEDEAGDDCGCDSGGVGSGWLVLAVLGIGRRRRP